MSPTQTQLPVGTYKLDSKASTLAFSTKHMFGTGKVNGSFAAASATVEADGVRTVVDAIIDADSFSTGDERRDKKVKSAAFLDVANNPTITFHADRANRTDTGWTVDGTLTVRGTAGPAVLLVTDVRPDGDVIMAKATITIDRYAFGVTAMKGMAARQLTFAVNARFTRV